MSKRLIVILLCISISILILGCISIKPKTIDYDVSARYPAEFYRLNAEILRLNRDCILNTDQIACEKRKIERERLDRMIEIYGNHR